MTKFKEGDRIKMKQSCSGCIVGQEYVLVTHDGVLYAKGQDSPTFMCGCDSYWELVPKTATEIMSSTAGGKWYGYSFPRFEDTVYPNYIYTTDEFNCKFGQTKPKTMIQKITATLKRVLSQSMQSQYKAGFRNGDLALTQEGKNELLEILSVVHEKDFTDRANAIIEEAKEE